MTFRKSDDATIKEAKKYVPDFKVFYFKQGSFTTRYFYYEHAKKDLPLLVLIHGAPGSSSALLNFLKCKVITENYSVLILDRMGYGYSDYGQFASIQKQSENTISLISYRTDTINYKETSRVNI
jgi:pimeloyl-ACP methyl ester carboxylesterase